MAISVGAGTGTDLAVKGNSLALCLAEEGVPVTSICLCYQTKACAKAHADGRDQASALPALASPSRLRPQVD